MDRSTYGEVDPSEQIQYKPFQLTKKDKPAPGCECPKKLQKFIFLTRATGHVIAAAALWLADWHGARVERGRTSRPF
jgi:hypothetical protein